MSFVRFGLNPDCKELSAEVALARCLKVEIAAVQRITKIKVLVQHSLRRVGVRIDHEGGAVHRIRSLYFDFCHGWRFAGCVLGPNQGRNGYKKNDEYCVRAHWLAMSVNQSATPSFGFLLPVDVNRR